MYGKLAIGRASVVDNGERGRRGPLGRIILRVYDNDSSLHESLLRKPSRNRYPRGLNEITLPGPARDGKWDDGDDQRYAPPLELLDWRSERDSVIVFCYERDPGRSANDGLFVGVVNRLGGTGATGGQVLAKKNALVRIRKRAERGEVSIAGLEQAVRTAGGQYAFFDFERSLSERTLRPPRMVLTFRNV